MVDFITTVLLLGVLVLGNPSVCTDYLYFGLLSGPISTTECRKWSMDDPIISIIIYLAKLYVYECVIMIEQTA